MSENQITGLPRRLQPIQCMGLGKVFLGNNVIFGFPKSPSFFSSYAYLEARNVNSFLSIGSGTWINNNFSANAEHHSIVIGEKCFIGSNVEIYDSDFHGQKPQDRSVSSPCFAKSVLIGDEVFIGSNGALRK